MLPCFCDAHGSQSENISGSNHPILQPLSQVGYKSQSHVIPTAPASPGKPARLLNERLPLPSACSKIQTPFPHAIPSGWPVLTLIPGDQLPLSVHSEWNGLQSSVVEIIVSILQEGPWGPGFWRLVEERALVQPHLSSAICSCVTLEKSHHLSDLGFSFVESEGSSLPFSVLRKIQENKSKSPVLCPAWNPCFLMTSCFCSGYCHDSCCCWG